MPLFFQNCLWFFKLRHVEFVHGVYSNIEKGERVVWLSTKRCFLKLRKDADRKRLFCSNMCQHFCPWLKATDHFCKRNRFIYTTVNSVGKAYKVQDDNFTTDGLGCSASHWSSLRVASAMHTWWGGSHSFSRLSFYRFKKRIIVNSYH